MILFLWISFTKKTLKSNFVSTENFCIFGDVLSNFGRTILDIWSNHCQLISYWRQNRIHSVDMLADAMDLSFHLIGELHIFSGSNINPLSLFSGRSIPVILKYFCWMSFQNRFSSNQNSTWVKNLEGLYSNGVFYVIL